VDRLRTGSGTRRLRSSLAGGLVLASCCLATGSAAASTASSTAGANTSTVAAVAVQVPATPVGKQLAWLLSIPAQLPLSAGLINAHFDAAFRAQVSDAELNQGLESLGSSGSTASLLSLSHVTPTALEATVRIGSSGYTVDLAVDGSGLIDGLLFKPVALTTPRSWAQVDSQLASVAPETSFLAAKVSPSGTCKPVHSVTPNVARPLGSMFKLFVLGALAQAISHGTVAWDQVLALSQQDKVGGSGTLQYEPVGTRLTVEQAAVKMISVSDNTAADMLLALVGRSAVEAQVAKWSDHASLDNPFLTVKEMFTLKYADFPVLADHYLSLGPAQRAAYLATTVDKVPNSAQRDVGAPRDINSIEWFASANDLCRALSGLAHLQAEPGLSPLATVMSTNNGGISLSATTWPKIWFKGGSEPGVLTLGYLAGDAHGNTFVVIALTEDTVAPVQEPLAVELRALDAISGAFGLLEASVP
jgi:beta-lactamase class A